MTSKAIVIYSFSMMMAIVSSCKKKDEPKKEEAGCDEKIENLVIERKDCFLEDTASLPAYCNLLSVTVEEKCQTRLTGKVDVTSTSCQFAVLRKRFEYSDFDTIAVFKVPRVIVPPDPDFGFIDKSVNNDLYRYTYKFIEVNYYRGIVCESNELSTP